MSATPYELRWQVIGPEPFEVMHVFIGLPIFSKAIKDVLGVEADAPTLREVSGERDPILTALLDQLRTELISHTPASPLFVSEHRAKSRRAFGPHLHRPECRQARAARRCTGL
jgi:AraC family transcriptional regulator